MNLRLLKPEDAPLMLEWMHDNSVVNHMRKNFASKSLEECISFIKAAQDAKDNLHLAIVNEQDTYMGTVSLKHITEKTAEFGITVRKCAMGKGYSKFGMDAIVKKGFKELGISTIYWCVSPRNSRAIGFYNKNGYKCGIFPDEAKFFYASEELHNYIWYSVTNN